MVEALSAGPRRCRGLLFVGDPHLTSTPPARRRAGYAEAVLGKLSRCIERANERRLVPVLLGDLFHFPLEPDEALKTRLARVLRSCWAVPLSNVGNHDGSGVAREGDGPGARTGLQDGDSLAMLAASGALLVPQAPGPLAEFVVEGPLGEVRVGLGATPYGCALPDHDVSADFPLADGVVWLTHHDLAFDGAYPKALPLREIRGCGMAVNGHMHDRKPAVVAGGTTWYNPGSLARTAVDSAPHRPAALAFAPADDGVLEWVHVPAQPDAFDLTGRLVPAAAARPEAESLPPSRFAAMLVDEVMSGAARTGSGAILREELVSFLAESGASDAARAALLGYLRAAAPAADPAADG